MKEDIIIIERYEKVVVVKLNRGVTNAINLELILKLREQLDHIQNDSSITSIILTGVNEKFFSIGFDIPSLIDLNVEKMREFYRNFNELCIKLFTFPKPTIALIKGHCTAGGCILALCCDFRLISEGRKLMGLNEILLGVPVPYLADRILTMIIGTRKARDLMISGAFYKPENLKKLGIIDEIIPINEIDAVTIDKARALSELPLEAYSRIKENRTEPIMAEVEEKIQKKQEIFIENWYSAKTRKILEETRKKY